MAAFLDAAIAVMSRDKPLTTGEITQRILERGLVRTRGLTPEATLAAELYRELKRPDSRVRRLYTLRNGRVARGSVKWVRA